MMDLLGSRRKLLVNAGRCNSMVVSVRLITTERRTWFLASFSGCHTCRAAAGSSALLMPFRSLNRTHEYISKRLFNSGYNVNYVSSRGSYPPPPRLPSVSHPEAYNPLTGTNYDGARAPNEESLQQLYQKVESIPPAPPLGTEANPIIVATAKSASSSGRGILWMIFLFFLFSTVFTAFFTAIGFFMSGATGGVMDEPHSVLSRIRNAPPQPVDLDDLDVTFSTIRGCDEAKEELEDLVAFLKDPEKFTSLGGRLPKGVLLVGPPGCGKTLLAKAIAKEAGVSFFYAAASEFDELFVGVGPRRIRELFAAAKGASPAIIFIDEIDALAASRRSTDHGTSRMSLNQLLSEMDGFQSSSSVIVIAATNTPEVLDKAVTRPGRFDTTVAVDPPDMQGRADVLQVYLDKIKVDPAVKAMDIARGTTGFTGAELSNLVNLSAIRAATLNKGTVEWEDIEFAKDRVMMGAESRKQIPEEERRITAFHEGGHALAALLLEEEGAEPIHKATIVPRGSGIMGLVQQLPKKDKYSQTKRQCLARLKVCLAGRIGEEIILGADDVTTGASSDFQQASEMARNMIRRFGFSNRFGTVFFPNTNDTSSVSDDTKHKIDEEVQELVNNAYQAVKALLLNNRTKLDRIAEGLLERETLTGDEIRMLSLGKPLPPATEKPMRQKTPPKEVTPKKDVKKPAAAVPIDCRTVPIS